MTKRNRRVTPNQFAAAHLRTTQLGYTLVAMLDKHRRQGRVWFGLVGGLVVLNLTLLGLLLWGPF